MDILRSLRTVSEASGPGVVDWDRAAAAAKASTDSGSIALTEAERAGYAADVRDARSRLREVAGIEFDVPDTSRCRTGTTGSTPASTRSGT